MAGRSKIICLAIVGIVLCLLVRGGVSWRRIESLSEDPDAYRILAETVATQGVFGLSDGTSPATPTAFRPPLYPWLLSWLVNADGVLASGAVAVLHVLLGVLTVGMTWDIARRFIGATGAVIAAGLVLLDPILLWQSTVVMTETLATTLATLAWWWWVVFVLQSACETNTCNAGTGKKTPETLDQPARTAPASPIVQAVLFAVVLGALLLVPSAVSCLGCFSIARALVGWADLPHSSTCNHRRDSVGLVGLRRRLDAAQHAGRWPSRVGNDSWWLHTLAGEQ